MNPTPTSSGEDSVLAQNRRGEIQLTDILSDSKYAKAKYVFPPIYAKPGKNIYEIVNAGGERYVLKLVDVPASHRGAVERLHSEYTKMGTLFMGSPHFVMPLDYKELQCGTATTRVEILAEYGGKDLLALSRTAKKEEVLMWILQSVIALRFCEARRICHLDIKPQNMIFKDGILRVIDLGSSIMFKLQAEVTSPLCEYLRELAELTCLYAPPELVTDMANADVSKLVASKMDVYYWGMTFYMLLTGISMSELQSLRKARINTTEAEYNKGFLAEVKARKELREFSSNVNMAEIISECLRYNPSERCSFEQLEQWLEPVSGFTYRTSEEAAEMYLAIGNSYNYEVGNTGISLRYLQKSLDMKHKGGSDPTNQYSWMADVYGSAGENEKEIKYYTKVLQMQEKTLDPKHIDIARTYIYLGLAYTNLGDFTKAEACIFKGMKMVEETLGPEHRTMAFSYNSVGHLYTCTGKYREALEYFIKASEVYEKTGETSGDAMLTCDHLGKVSYLLGNYKEALEYHTATLKAEEEFYGVEHPSVANTYQDMANDYYRMKEYDNALEYGLKALAIREKTYGADSIITAQSYARIGEVYQSLGCDQMAQDYMHKALHIHERLFGTEHANTAEMYVSVGDSYRIARDSAKALEYHTKAVKILEKTHGPKHPYTAAAYKGMGMDLFYLDQYAQCLP